MIIKLQTDIAAKFTWTCEPMVGDMYYVFIPKSPPPWSVKNNESISIKAIKSGMIYYKSAKELIENQEISVDREEEHLMCYDPIMYIETGKYVSKFEPGLITYDTYLWKNKLIHVIKSCFKRNSKLLYTKINPLSGAELP
jgi:hypothetical protein